MASNPDLVAGMLRQETNKNIITSRMVYYFSASIHTQCLSILAQDKQPFVVGYLQLFDYLPEVTIRQLNRSGPWKETLKSAIIHYLLTTDTIHELELLKQSWATLNDQMQAVILKDLQTICHSLNQQEKRIIHLLPLLQRLDKMKSQKH